MSSLRTYTDVIKCHNYNHYNEHVSRFAHYTYMQHKKYNKYYINCDDNRSCHRSISLFPAGIKPASEGKFAEGFLPFWRTPGFLESRRWVPRLWGMSGRGRGMKRWDYCPLAGPRKRERRRARQDARNKARLGWLTGSYRLPTGKAPIITSKPHQLILN